ncbi:MAG: threonine/serine dehydratase [Pseudomonadota bacterium]
MTQYSINRDTISTNYDRLRGHIRRTPVLLVAAEDLGLKGSEIHLKLELFQHSGSFKARGALTHFLLGDIPEAGVAAASGGNHGAAVAYAAKALHKPATIFVPEISSPAKQASIRALGANLEVIKGQYADASDAAERHCVNTGAKNIHAYNQPETLVGQGSLALEFDAQSPRLSTILVAIGGGGLIGGMAAWYQGSTRLIGVEPETCATAKAALDVGRPVDVEVDVNGLAADSLGARRVGSLPFPLIQSYVEDVLTVSDDAIRRAQALLWDKTRIVAEPGGAAALAALLSGAYVPDDNERIGIVICGANTTGIDFG